MNSRTPIQYQSNSSPHFEKNGHFLSGPFVSSTSAPELLPSTTLLDRFKVKRHICDGKGSAVYLAEDLLESIEVVLKIVDAGPQSEEWKTARLHREMRVSRTISEFKHVIRVYDIHNLAFGGTELLFLSMEHADGGSLREWLIDNQEDTPLRHSIGLDYFLQVCRGLSFIHEAGITHLDIKPENMLFSNGVLKIADLGSAIGPRLLKETGQPCEGCSLSDRGTPRYLSPEQFTVSDSTNLSATSDIYSLGVVLYELLHPQCRPPFDGTLARLRELHTKMPPPPLPDVPEKLSNVINRCLEKKPDSRYQNMQEMLADLEDGPANSAAGATEGLELIWNKGQESFSRGDLNEASRFLEEVLCLNPGHAPAKELLDEIRARFDQAEQCYTMIMDDIEEGDLDTLTVLLQEAVATYPEHPAGAAAQTRLGARTKQLRDSLELAVAELRNGHWEMALHWLERAIQLGPGNIWLKSTIEVLTFIKAIRDEINQVLLRNNLNEARRLASLMDAVVEELRNSVPALRE
jgi:serine/threonine protein kinase